MMVKSVNSERPNYKATLKGAVAGAAAGAVGWTSVYSCYNVPKMIIKSAKSLNEKKELLGLFQEGLSKALDIDFSKNTVSKVCKSVQKLITKPSVIAGTLAIAAGIGGAIGLAVDCVKNRKAKKA